MLAEDLMAPTVLTSKDMPYVMFETRTIEDPVRTKAEGRMCFRDQVYAVSTVPGDKGNNIYEIESFFERKQTEMRHGRVHPDWFRKWQSDYELYKQGQSIPEDGTPIKGWKLLSGAQQEELIRINIRTVEALANMSDDGIKNFGMGAIELKRRAKSWLDQNENKESGAIKLLAMQRENDTLKGQVGTLSEKLEELEKALQGLKKK